MPSLTPVRLPDDVSATAGRVSREEVGGVRRLIKFRDLSVQHLGSIYERLFEFDVVAEAGTSMWAEPVARETVAPVTPRMIAAAHHPPPVGPLIDEPTRIRRLG